MAQPNEVEEVVKAIAVHVKTELRTAKDEINRVNERIERRSKDIEDKIQLLENKILTDKTAAPKDIVNKISGLEKKLAATYTASDTERMLDEKISRKLKEIEENYKSGSLLTGELKSILIEKVVQFLKQHNEKKAKARKDVDKIILIASPNHGISGDVAQYCGIFGEANHCKDMKYDSVFMNNLNGGNKPNIPVYNIIGTGCDTYGEDGDGIVTSKSSFLDFANNFYVDGTCDNLFDPLHARIVQPDEYPITYEKILDILKT